MLGILGLWQQTGSHGNFIQYNPIFLSLPSSPLGSYYLMADFRLTPKEEVMQRSLSTSRFKQIEFVFPLWSQGRQEPISYFICAFLLLFSQNWNLVYIWKVHSLLWKNRSSSFGRKFWALHVRLLVIVSALRFMTPPSYSYSIFSRAYLLRLCTPEPQKKSR